MYIKFNNKNNFFHKTNLIIIIIIIIVFPWWLFRISVYLAFNSNSLILLRSTFILWYFVLVDIFSVLIYIHVMSCHVMITKTTCITHTLPHAWTCTHTQIERHTHYYRLYWPAHLSPVSTSFSTLPEDWTFYICHIRTT